MFILVDFATRVSTHFEHAGTATMDVTASVNGCIRTCGAHEADGTDKWIAISLDVRAGMVT